MTAFSWVSRLLPFLVAGCAMTGPRAVAHAPIASAAHIQPPETVVIRSGNLKLKGILWQPTGKGPCPAVLFNHGSWPTNNR
ncbi:MAG TPA: hypothetical protein VF850_12460, partial [Gemmatimonadaceae bacterium]